MRLSVCIAALVIILLGGCRTSAEQDLLSEQIGAYRESRSIGKDTTVVWLDIEQMPSIIGGMAGIQKKLQYPQDAREAGIEGWVFVKFTVNLDGRPQSIEIYSGLHPSCDAEAIRLVKETKFIPGKLIKAGIETVIAMPMSLPIEFKLSSN